MDNIIKAEDYRGTSIYDTIVSDSKNEQIIRETIANNLRKGLITRDQFNKANAQLDDLIKAGKKTGAGSRGGKIIGHTKSGKPIYATNAFNIKHKDFSHEDHEHAREILAKKAGEHHEKWVRGGRSRWSQHKRDADYYEDLAKEHKKEAEKKASVAGLSTDEKKIIADQKKQQQVSLHEKMYDFHSDIANYIDTKHMLNKDARETYHYHLIQASRHKSEKERLEKE